MANILTEKTPARSLVRAKTTVNIQWRNYILPLGIFLIALLPRLLMLDAFLTADEDDQIMFAHLFLKSALQGDWAGALVLGYPGVPTLILGALGVGLRYICHYNDWLPLPWVQADLMPTLDQLTTHFGVFAYPMDFLVWVRVPMAVVGALCVLGIFGLTRRLLDDRLALLASLIIAFDPFILAHTRVIHVDAPLAYFMFLSFLAFLLYLTQGGWKWLLISGLFGGLAVLSKTPAVLLGPILVASGLLYALFPPPTIPRSLRWKRLVMALGGWGLVAAGAIFALWPSMWADPLHVVDRLVSNVQSVNQMAHPTTGIFWGEQQSDQNPFYYLIAFPYHLTPLTTIGVGFSLVMIMVGLGVWWRWRPEDDPAVDGASWLPSILPLAMSLGVYIIIFVAPVSAISRRGDRYILPVFFAAALLAVLALWWLVTLLKRIFPAWLARLRLSVPLLIGGAVGLQSLLVLLYHPYYLAYYNPLLGGARTAPFYVNIGWGEGLDLAAAYLNDLTGSESPAVAAWYSAQFAPFYHGPTLDLSDQSSALTGDYTVFYINQVQRGFPSREILDYFQQREPLKVITLGGIDYAWIYEGPVVSQEPPTNYVFPAEVVMGGGAHLVGVDVPRLTMPADAYAVSSEQQEIAVAGLLPALKSRQGFVKMPPGLPVTLYWETLAEINGEHNIYIRLVDEQGNSWGQVDRLILAGLWRPDRWKSGYFLRDEYKLPIDPGTPPGIYHLEVGMYDFVTGHSYGVARNIGEITLTPPEDPPRPDDIEWQTRLDRPVGDSLILAGHDFVDTQAPPGADVGGKIFWQATGSITQDYLIEFSLLAPNRKQYIITDMPLSSGYPTSMWRTAEVVGTAYGFRIPAWAPAGTYSLLINVLDPHTKKYIGEYTILGDVTVEAVERNYNLPQGVTPVSAFLNNEIELVGYKLIDLSVAPRETFGLTLYWRTLDPPADNYTVFVHVVGPDQVMRGQWDSVPVQGSLPTSGWLPGEIIEDHYEVPMEKDAPPWKYDIFVGMYNTQTGQRLPVESLYAPLSDNRVWLTRVQVVEP